MKERLLKSLNDFFESSKNKINDKKDSRQSIIFTASLCLEVLKKDSSTLTTQSSLEKESKEQSTSKFDLEKNTKNLWDSLKRYWKEKKESKKILNDTFFNDLLNKSWIALTATLSQIHEADNNSPHPLLELLLKEEPLEIKQEILEAKNSAITHSKFCLALLEANKYLFSPELYLENFIDLIGIENLHTNLTYFLKTKPENERADFIKSISKKGLLRFIVNTPQKLASFLKKIDIELWPVLFENLSEDEFIEIFQKEGSLNLIITSLVPDIQNSAPKFIDAFLKSKYLLDIVRSQPTAFIIILEQIPKEIRLNFTIKCIKKIESSKSKIENWRPSELAQVLGLISEQEDDLIKFINEGFLPEHLKEVIKNESDLPFILEKLKNKPNAIKAFINKLGGEYLRLIFDDPHKITKVIALFEESTRCDFIGLLGHEFFYNKITKLTQLNYFLSKTPDNCRFKIIELLRSTSTNGQTDYRLFTFIKSTNDLNEILKNVPSNQQQKFIDHLKRRRLLRRFIKNDKDLNAVLANLPNINDKQFLLDALIPRSRLKRFWNSLKHHWIRILVCMTLTLGFLFFTPPGAIIAGALGLAIPTAFANITLAFLGKISLILLMSPILFRIIGEFFQGVGKGLLGTFLRGLFFMPGGLIRSGNSFFKMLGYFLALILNIPAYLSKYFGKIFNALGKHIAGFFWNEVKLSDVVGNQAEAKEGEKTNHSLYTPNNQPGSEQKDNAKEQNKNKKQAEILLRSNTLGDYPIFAPEGRRQFATCRRKWIKQAVTFFSIEENEKVASYSNICSNTWGSVKGWYGR